MFKVSLKFRGIWLRKEHNFTKIEDIMKVKGIGKKLFEKIKSEICVECKKSK